MIILFLIFLRNLYTDLHTGETNLHFHQKDVEVWLPPIPSPAFIFLLDDIHSAARWNIKFHSLKL